MLQESAVLPYTFGCRRLYTHVDCDNDAAWRLYQQQGFEVYDDAACTLPGVAACNAWHLQLGMCQICKILKNTSGSWLASNMALLRNAHSAERLRMFRQAGG